MFCDIAEESLMAMMVHWDACNCSMVRTWDNCERKWALGLERERHVDVSFASVASSPNMGFVYATNTYGWVEKFSFTNSFLYILMLKDNFSLRLLLLNNYIYFPC